MTALKVIIDTDPGLGEPGSDIDDGLAIAMALRSPELDVLALTTVNGNVDVETGTDVARHLTERLGVPELPVLRGASHPLKRDMAPVRALFDAVMNGSEPHTGSTRVQGPTSDEPAWSYLAATAREQPGEVTVIAIGPMTNLALALQEDQEFGRNVRELILMAGSATTYAQNVTVIGDFNAYVDPEALDIVMRSDAKIRMVGLDQTSRVMLTRQDATHLREDNSAFSQWVADCTDAWIDFLQKAFPNRPEHALSCFLHDPLVVSAAIMPEMFTWAEAHVAVEVGISELARGLVVADRGLALRPADPANAIVAIDTDVNGFREFFLSRMKSAPAT